MKGLSSELQSYNVHFNIESGFEGEGEFGSLLKEEWNRLIVTCPNLVPIEQNVLAMRTCTNLMICPVLMRTLFGITN